MPSIIRTSDRSTFRRCRNLWDFTSRIRRNYEPVREAEALEFGTAFHVALEVWYDPAAWEQDRLVQVALAKQAFKDVNDKQRAVLKDNLASFWTRENDEEFDQREELGMGMLDNYFQYSLANDVGVIKPILVEYEFEIPLWDGDVLYQGKIDMIAENSDGLLYLWDHKTAGKFDATDWLDMDTQISSYCWAASRLGYPVEGFVYNRVRKDYPQPPKALQKGGLSKDKRQNTTYELYVQTLQEHGLDQADYNDILQHLIDEPKVFIDRKQVDRSTMEIARQEQIILDEIKDMLGNPAIYPNPSSFNCNYCKFFTPCLLTMEGEDPMEALEDELVFRKREV